MQFLRILLLLVFVRSSTLAAELNAFGYHVPANAGEVGENASGSYVIDLHPLMIDKRGGVWKKAYQFIITSNLVIESRGCASDGSQCGEWFPTNLTYWEIVDAEVTGDRFWVPIGQSSISVKFSNEPGFGATWEVTWGFDEVQASTDPIFNQMDTYACNKFNEGPETIHADNFKLNQPPCPVQILNFGPNTTADIQLLEEITVPMSWPTYPDTVFQIHNVLLTGNNVFSLKNVKNVDLGGGFASEIYLSILDSNTTTATEYLISNGTVDYLDGDTSSHPSPEQIQKITISNANVNQPLPLSQKFYLEDSTVSLDYAPSFIEGQNFTINYVGNTPFDRFGSQILNANLNWNGFHVHGLTITGGAEDSISPLGIVDIEASAVNIWGNLTNDLSIFSDSELDGEMHLSNAILSDFRRVYLVGQHDALVRLSNVTIDLDTTFDASFASLNQVTLNQGYVDFDDSEADGTIFKGWPTSNSSREFWTKRSTISNSTIENFAHVIFERDSMATATVFRNVGVAWLVSTDRLGEVIAVSDPEIKKEVVNEDKETIFRNITSPVTILFSKAGLLTFEHVRYLRVKGSSDAVLSIDKDGIRVDGCLISKMSPVFARNGASTFNEIDLALKTREHLIQLSRSYSSANQSFGPMGARWDVGGNIRLYRFTHPEQKVSIYLDTNSSKELFVQTGVSYSYVSLDKTFFSTDTFDDGRFEVSNNAGQHFVFEDKRSVTYPDRENFVLIERSDAGAYKLLYNYDTEGRLINVSEVLDSQISPNSNDPQLIYSYNQDGLIDSASNNGRELHQYFYDDHARLIEVHTQYGLKMAYYYEDDNYPYHLTSVVNEAGNKVQSFDYNSEGRVSHYIDFSEEGFLTYNHDGSVKSSIKPKPGGSLSKSVVLSDGYIPLQSIISGNGTTRTVTNLYNSRNQKVAVKDTDGYQTHFVYNDDGTVASQKTLEAKSQNFLNPLTNPGFETIFAYTFIAGSPRLTEQILVQSEGPNVVKTFNYLPNGKLFRTVLGNSEILRFYDSLGRLESVQKNEYGETGTVIDSRITKFLTYNPQGYVESVYNGRKDLNGVDILTFFEYDDWGNVTKVTDPRGVETYNTYNPQNQILTKTIVDTIGVSPDHLTEYEYDEHGRLKKIIGPNGRFQEYIYDHFSRVYQIRDQFSRVNTTHYDSFGRVSSVQDVHSSATDFIYNVFDELISTQTPNGHQDLTKFDNRGLPIEKTNFDGSQSFYGYDALGRLNQTSIEVLPGETLVSSTTYFNSGEVKEQTAVNGQKTEFSYDSQRRLIESKKFDRFNQNPQLSSYEYDIFGAFSKVAVLSATQTIYFDYNQNTQTTYDSLGRQTISKFDRNGNLIEKIDRNGKSYHFEYDFLNRLTKFTYPNGVYKVVEYDLNSNVTATKHYDNQDQLIKQVVNDYNLGDQLVDQTVTDYLTSSSKTIAFSFDKKDQLISTRELDSNLEMFRGYDAEGNNNQVEYPFLNRRLTHSYDGLSRVVNSIFEDTKNHQINFRAYNYDALSRLRFLYDENYGGAINFAHFDSPSVEANPLRKTIAYIDGSSSNYLTDNFDRIANIQHANPQAQPDLLVNYGYDSNNRIQSKTILDVNQIPLQQEGYGYDPMHRLVQVQKGPEVTIFNRDNNDNLTSITDTQYPLENKTIDLNLDYPDQATGIYFNDFSFAGDIDINELGQTESIVTLEEGYVKNRSFSYDPLSRLVSVETIFSDPISSSVVKHYLSTYAYLPGSELRFKTTFQDVLASTSEVSYTLYDGSQEIEFLDENLDSHSKILNHPYNLDERYLIITQGGSNQQLLRDLQNSVNSIRTTSGISYIQYFEADGRQAAGKPSFDTFTYTGRPFDDFAELYYYRGRYMDSCSGRFLKEDPMQADLNWYAYSANPVMSTDPTGFAENYLVAKEHSLAGGGTSHDIVNDVAIPLTKNAANLVIPQTPEDLARLNPYIDFSYAIKDLVQSQSFAEGAGNTVNVLLCAVPGLPAKFQKRAGDLTEELVDFTTRKRGGGKAPKSPTLNLGAGDNPLAGAVNVDLRAVQGVDVVADATKLPFKPGTFGDAHSINPYGFNPVSQETARVLKPGAILKVTGTQNNKFARPLTAEQARAAGFELIETKPLEAIHNFGVQRATSGRPLQTSGSVTTTYRRLGN